MKHCSDCNTDKALDEFPVHSVQNGVVHYYGYCKPCKRIRRNAASAKWRCHNKQKELVRGREYRQNNKQKEQARAKRYQQSHRDIVNANTKRYYYRHREERLEYHKKQHFKTRDKRLRQQAAYRKDNLEKLKNLHKSWRERNPDKVNVYRHVRRARQSNASGSHTAEERRLVLESCAGLCFYCQQKSATVTDHVIPLSRGGTNAITNLLPSCFSCNVRKGDKTAFEYFAWLKT